MEKTVKGKRCLRLFISFWAVIFYVLPVILAVLLRFKILPDIFNICDDREMTLFEICKDIVCWLPLYCGPIYIVMLAGSGFILGKAAYGMDTVFFCGVAVTAMAIPPASMLWWLDDVVGIGTCAVLAAVFFICLVSGFVGQDSK